MQCFNNKRFFFKDCKSSNDSSRCGRSRAEGSVILVLSKTGSFQGRGDTLEQNTNRQALALARPVYHIRTYLQHVYSISWTKQKILRKPFHWSNTSMSILCYVPPTMVTFHLLRSTQALCLARNFFTTVVDVSRLVVNYNMLV